MPIYEYECKKCKRITTKEREPSARRMNTRCEHCGSKTELIISRSSFVLQGGGWASTGYSKGK